MENSCGKHLRNVSCGRQLGNVVVEDSSRKEVWKTTTRCSCVRLLRTVVAEKTAIEYSNDLRYT